MKLEFSRQVLEKKVRYQVPSKSIQWKPELFHADGRTDITKLIVAFCNITNAPKNGKGKWEYWLLLSIDTKNSNQMAVRTTEFWPPNPGDNTVMYCCCTFLRSSLVFIVLKHSYYFQAGI